MVEEDKEGKPYSRDERKMVYARADGTTTRYSFGSEFNFYAANYAWIQHSIAAREKAKEPFRIAIGGPQCAKPYSASLLNISAMSFGSLGASRSRRSTGAPGPGGFAHDTGEGGSVRYHRAPRRRLRLGNRLGLFRLPHRDGRVRSGSSPTRRADPQVKMVEIKL